MLKNPKVRVFPLGGTSEDWEFLINEELEELKIHFIESISIIVEQNNHKCVIIYQECG